MTTQATIIGDPAYRPLLDHGFVGLRDHMGDDEAIIEAARVSYAKGTKKTSSSRTLLRYLMRHRHSTPFEMCELKFHVRAPIFVFRQWHRHRTASINEESGRYSEMADEFYMPARQVIQPQSSDNKQGRSGEISEKNAEGVRWLLDATYQTAKRTYDVLLRDVREGLPDEEVIWDAFNEDDPLLDKEYPGIARELARVGMPLGSYSEMYWKTNLKNLFHFVSLRADPHAQTEIRVYADAMFDLVRGIFPQACEAFDDYVMKAATFSRMERNVMALLLPDAAARLDEAVDQAGGVKSFAALHGMSTREVDEMRAKLTL